MLTRYLSRSVDTSNTINAELNHGWISPYYVWVETNANPPYNPRHVPVIEQDTEIATNWLHLALCPYYYKREDDVPCGECINKFLDGLEDLEG